MVFASSPVDFGHALGRPAGRGAQQQPDGLRRENAQDRVDDGGLADARSAGDDQNLGQKGQPHRRLLAVGERQAGALLDPGQRLVRIAFLKATSSNVPPCPATVNCTLELAEDAPNSVPNHMRLCATMICPISRIWLRSAKKVFSSEYYPMLNAPHLKLE